MSTKPPVVAEIYDEWLRRPEVDAVAATCRFFKGDDSVHQTLRKIATKLDELGIAYAVAGGMALSAHRFVRATVDVDILVTGSPPFTANSTARAMYCPSQAART
jgi:hypothetical protein